MMEWGAKNRSQLGSSFGAGNTTVCGGTRRKVSPGCQRARRHHRQWQSCDRGGAAEANV